VLTQERVILLKTMIYKQADDFNVNIKEMEADKDHIHILFSSKPSLRMTDFVKKVKGVSSRALRLKYSELLKEVQQKHLWSPSYFLSTTGGVTIEVIKKYIESQGR
jgi:putative transposase